MSRKWMAVMFLAVSGAAPMAALAEGPVGTSGGPEITNIRGCIAYENENFAGSSFDIVDGTRHPHVGDDWNDRISSIACSSGCVMTTYEDINYAGDWHFWRGNNSYVGDDWNDRMSSFTVDCSEAQPQSQPKQGSSNVLVPEPSTGPSPFEPPPAIESVPKPPSGFNPNTPPAIESVPKPPGETGKFMQQMRP
jgi:hypothetical protein